MNQERISALVAPFMGLADLAASPTGRQIFGLLRSVLPDGVGGKTRLIRFSTEGTADAERLLDSSARHVVAHSVTQVALASISGEGSSIEFLDSRSLVTESRWSTADTISALAVGASGDSLLFLCQRARSEPRVTTSSNERAELLEGGALVRLRLPELTEERLEQDGVTAFAEHASGVRVTARTIPSASSVRHQLWIHTADGPRRIAPSLAAIAALRFSPSGKQLAVLASERDLPLVDFPLLRVGVIDLATEKLSWLSAPSGVTKPNARPEAELAWLDESRLIHRSTASGCIHLTVSTRSGNITFWGGSRQVNAFACFDDGVVAADATAEASLSLRWLSPTGSETSCWSPNRELDNWCAGIGSTSIQFRSSQGNDIAGWVLGNVRPKAPVVVSLHGGPHGFVGPGLSLTHFYRWLLADRGFVVMALNPTGSGAFSEEHLLRGRGQWGTTDATETIEGLDDLVARGWAGSGYRAGLVGYSYGGFLGARLATTTRRFAAAALGSAPTDLRTWYADSDIGPRFLSWHFDASSEDFWDRLSAASIAVPNRLDCRVLLMQGTADRRCPPSGMRLLAERLWRSGTPTSLVEYPGAGHDLPGASQPDVFADYHSRISNWFGTSQDT